MGLIRLKNKRRRMFVADLENSPDESKQTVRTTHDAKTGTEGISFVSYQTYKQVSLLPMQTSDALDEKVLENASIRGAIGSGWLQVLR